MYVLLLFIVLAIIAMIIIFVTTIRNKKEPFAQVLGALAPYQTELAHCISDCEREDPNRRLQADGNWSCDRYCYSKFTDFAREKKKMTSFEPEYNTEQKCELQCRSGDKTADNKCKSMCHCVNEVAKWCKELWCPYTHVDTSECMKQCIATNLTNCNQVSWTWKSHG